MCTVDLATANVCVRVRVRYSKKTTKKKRKKNCLNLRCKSKSKSKSKQNKNKNNKLSKIEKKNEIIIQLYSPQEHQQQKVAAKKKIPHGVRTAATTKNRPMLVHMGYKKTDVHGGSCDCQCACARARAL